MNKFTADTIDEHLGLTAELSRTHDKVCRAVKRAKKNLFPIAVISRKDLCGNKVLMNVTQSSKYSKIKLINKKKKCQFIFKNSLQSVVSYAIVALSAHFVLDHKTTPQKYKTILESAKTAIKLASKLNKGINEN